MEQETKLEWKPKTWTCPKCGAIVGNEQKKCPNCWHGPLPLREINEIVNKYYRELGIKRMRSFRNY